MHADVPGFGVVRPPDGNQFSRGRRVRLVGRVKPASPGRGHAIRRGNDGKEARERAGAGLGADPHPAFAAADHVPNLTVGVRCEGRAIGAGDGGGETFTRGVLRV